MTDIIALEQTMIGFLDKKTSLSKWESVFLKAHDWMIQNIYTDYPEEGQIEVKQTPEMLNSKHKQSSSYKICNGARMSQKELNNRRTVYELLENFTLPH